MKRGERMQAIDWIPGVSHFEEPVKIIDWVPGVTHIAYVNEEE